jgi:hypothetical protein
VTRGAAYTYTFPYRWKVVAHVQQTRAEQDILLPLRPVSFLMRYHTSDARVPRTPGGLIPVRMSRLVVNDSFCAILMLRGR